MLKNQFYKNEYRIPYWIIIQIKMMKFSPLSILIITSLWIFSILNCSSVRTEDKVNANEGYILPGEIIFHTIGSSFSPVLTLQGQAEVKWIWEDNTTSNSLIPKKDYGSAQPRQNRLIVTPWSALRRINIGYDGGDGGSTKIEFVGNQQVSKVENLELVAPFLKEWCSSYNNLSSLNFDNFINLETIECFQSVTLKNISLFNTPKLKRACFENNDLVSLDLSDCNSLEDIRGAFNNYTTIIFPNKTENLWHLCIGNNPQITDKHLLNDLSKFPNLVELIISDTNQDGSLIISSSPERQVDLNAEKNNYTSMDLKGALKYSGYPGNVFMSHNQFTSVDIAGCVQINRLDLSDNKLDSEAIDHVLKQVDDFGTANGTIDLRENNPPTAIGITYIKNLEKRGWTVHTDEIITGNIETKENILYFFNISTNLASKKIKVQLEQIPNNNLMIEIRDESGKKLLEQRVLSNICELPLQSPGIYFLSLRSKNWVKTQKFISLK